MTRLTRRQFSLATAAVLAAPGLVGTARAQAKTLTFGGSIPLSGRAAETGLNVIAGYQAAVKFINDKGGVEIGGQKYMLDLKMFDDASDPSRATTLIQQQLDQGIDFFLGSFGSNIVLPTAAITERARKPMVQAGGGSDQIFTQGYRYVFGVYPRASRQYISSVEFFKTLRPKPESFSVIFTNDAFSRTQADGALKDMEAAGFKLMEKYPLPEQITDVSSVLNSIRAKTPDLVICTTHDQNSLLIARQMAASETNVKLLYQTLGPQLQSFREALGKFATSIIVQVYWDERANYKDAFIGSAKGFADYYRSINQRPLAYHTAAGAACIIIYLHAMQKAKSINPAAVRDALAETDIETLYGRVKFTKDGDGDPLLLGPRIGQVQKGNVEIVFPTEAASAKVIYPAPKWTERS
jgi:branched-chain amino acid transport system substrate-binding protein